MSVLAALVRYQLALLLASQRWLPPLLLYAAVLAVGVRPGDALLDSLGVSAATSLPVAAWLVHVCVTAEPDAARHCAAAAAGAARVHLGSVLAGALSAVLVGFAGTGLVVLIADPHSTDGRVRIPLPTGAGTGLLATLVCVLAGVAVGALCSRPLVRRRARALPALLTGTGVVLLAGASPANAAVTGLVTASGSGRASPPWGAAAVAALCVAGAVWAACASVTRRR